MEKKVSGLHHITAMAANAKDNYDFYTGVMGLRLVKKTVNFDDPGTYHFYFGDESGTPGTLLTFFPWEGMGRGRNGPGMATEIAWSVAADQLDFWQERLQRAGLAVETGESRFGAPLLRFADPDGLQQSLIAAKDTDTRKGWAGSGIAPEAAIKGFQGVTLTLRELAPTADLLTGILGYRPVGSEAGRYRFETDAIATASVVDILLAPGSEPGYQAAGTNHHIAFRVADDAAQQVLRAQLLEAGLQVTPPIDRDYFHSLYFREPGGVLFEIATDTPGFTVDEELSQLGQSLKLPVQYEGMRQQLESRLPKIH